MTDPNYLNSAAPPSEIYGHIVWLAGQVYNAASTFAYTLPQLLTLLGQGTEEERANNVKTILIGPGGLVSTADDMRTKTAVLVQKLAAFDIDITDANTQVQTYISKESDLMARTDQLIGATQNDIDNVLQPAADAAYKAWRDYTISAATTSVGVLACGDDDARNAARGVHDTVKGQYEAVASAASDAGVLATQSDEAVSIILGTIIDLRTRYQGVFDQLDAAKITPAEAVQQLELSVASQAFHDLAAYARQQLG